MSFDYITINFSKIVGFILLGVLAHQGVISWLVFFTIAFLMADLKVTFNKN